MGAPLAAEENFVETQAEMATVGQTGQDVVQSFVLSPHREPSAQPDGGDRRGQQHDQPR